MNICFSKMHGLGNDFIVIDDRKSCLNLSADQVRSLCNRHTGIGADGIMLVRPATNEHADYAWWFANADGTVPEMCGNGIRCFVKYLVENELVQRGATRIVVETAVGSLVTEVMYEGDLVKSVKVDMGSAELLASAIPTQLTPNTEVLINGQRHEAVVDASIQVPTALGLDIDAARVTAVSMGNPHAVLIANDYHWDLSAAPVQTLGRYLEIHEVFPAKTNVEFVTVHSREHVSMRVWERGCGETQACGTGACAVAVACYLKGLTSNVVTVSLLGGDLTIHVNPETLQVSMTGPATHVYSGELALHS